MTRTEIGKVLVTIEAFGQIMNVPAAQLALIVAKARTDLDLVGKITPPTAGQVGPLAGP